MSDIQHEWVKNQVGNLKDKDPKGENKWITDSLKDKKGIANAQDVFVVQSALNAL